MISTTWVVYSKIKFQGLCLSHGWISFTCMNQNVFKIKKVTQHHLLSRLHCLQMNFSPRCDVCGPVTRSHGCEAVAIYRLKSEGTRLHITWMFSSNSRIRNTGCQTGRQTPRQGERQADKEAHNQTGRQESRQVGRQADREEEQADRQTRKHTGREAGRREIWTRVGVI